MIDQDPLFEGHDEPLAPSTHILVVTGTDDVEFSIECSGVHPTCVGWIECAESHSLEDQEAIMGAAGEPVLLHGVPHVGMEMGEWVPTGTCILAECNDHWVNSVDELELKPGRYPVDFVFEDETVCYLTLIKDAS